MPFVQDDRFQQSMDESRKHSMNTRRGLNNLSGKPFYDYISSVKATPSNIKTFEEFGFSLKATVGIIYAIDGELHLQTGDVHKKVQSHNLSTHPILNDVHYKSSERWDKEMNWDNEAKSLNWNSNVDCQEHAIIPHANVYRKNVYFSALPAWEHLWCTFSF